MIGRDVPHGWVRERCSAYLSGELADAERQAFESHLAGCATCRAEVREVDQLVAALRSLPIPMPPCTFELTPAQAAQAERHRSWLWPLLPSLASGMATLLFLVVLVDVGGQVVGAPRASAPAPAAAQATAPGTEPRSLRAPAAGAPAPAAAQPAAPQAGKSTASDSAVAQNTSNATTAPAQPAAPMPIFMPPAMRRPAEGRLAWEAPLLLVLAGTAVASWAWRRRTRRRSLG